VEEVDAIGRWRPSPIGLGQARPWREVRSTRAKQQEEAEAKHHGERATQSLDWMSIALLLTSNDANRISRFDARVEAATWAANELALSIQRGRTDRKTPRPEGR